MKVPHFRSRFLFYVIRHMSMIALSPQTIKFLQISTRDQLRELLKKGGFYLRKRTSNATALLSDLDPADHDLATHKVLQDDEYLKILGILWNPTRDIFQFRVTVSSSARSKRAILSIAKFFDPLR